MDDRPLPNEQIYSTQLRLMLEELCSDLCRFEHVAKDRFSPQSIRINREQYLGSPGAFADIMVIPDNARPYAVEVKYGCCDSACRSLLVLELCTRYPGHGDHRRQPDFVLFPGEIPNYQQRRNALPVCWR